MKLKIEKVEKKFKENIVLKDVNLEFESGKIYGFIGRNGSGKTVLLKMICGFYYPTSGRILLDDYDYIDNNDFPKDTGALIEKPSFLPTLTGFENLKSLAKIQNKIDEEKINDALKVVNLFDEKDKMYYKYSLGMKQKLGIAQAIMENQKLIILDEPFNGIENETAEKLREYFKKIKKDKIIIIATHIKEDLVKLVDEIYEIDAGKITRLEKKK